MSELMNTVTSKKLGSAVRGLGSADHNAASSNASPLVNGMSPAAARTFKAMENEQTKEELGVSDKKIIIPSFHTTSKLFAQHFQILRDLKHRIDLLRQSYEDQRSEERSWEQVNSILHVLQEACVYLDFPSEEELQARALAEQAAREAKAASKSYRVKRSPTRPKKGPALNQTM